MKRHIVCFGDSNTHGYCAEPLDCADGGDRFNENERWTCLLQEALGDEYLVIEEGLSGRTTVFPDPLHESMSGLDSIYSCLMSHEPVDLLIIMLGTNDCKERFNASPACIGIGMQRLIMKAKNILCWKGGRRKILIVAPPHMKEGFSDPAMGYCCVEKSPHVAEHLRLAAELHNCAFLDAEGIAEFNTFDYTHLSRKGHRQLAEALAKLVPNLIGKC